MLFRSMDSEPALAHKADVSAERANEGERSRETGQQVAESSPAPEHERPLKRAPTRVTIQSDKPPPPFGAITKQSSRPIGSPASQPDVSPSDPFTPLNRSNTAASSSKAYSSFSLPTKYLIVGLGGIAAMLSPISSNIFVPAIPTLVVDFQRSSEQISLAVTIYLILCGAIPLRHEEEGADGTFSQPSYHPELLWKHERQLRASASLHRDAGGLHGREHWPRALSDGRVLAPPRPSSSSGTLASCLSR